MTMSEFIMVNVKKPPKNRPSDKKKMFQLKYLSSQSLSFIFDFI